MLDIQQPMKKKTYLHLRLSCPQEISICAVCLLTSWNAVGSTGLSSNISPMQEHSMKKQTTTTPWFVGLDEHGVARHAHMRSTNFKGRSFRINVESSLPQYSFHHAGPGKNLFVFESPIDLLSYICLHPEDWQSQSYVALCGTSGQAMLWLLEQNPGIQSICLALDNDKAGKTATERLARELRRRSYTSTVLIPQHKDWNDDLLACRNQK